MVTEDMPVAVSMSAPMAPPWTWRAAATPAAAPAGKSLRGRTRLTPVRSSASSQNAARRGSRATGHRIPPAARAGADEGPG